MAGFMYFIPIAIILGVMSFADVHGSCFTGKLMAEMTVSGRFRYYCEYTQNGHVIRMLPGSNMVLSDECLDCKCTVNGLQCCGFGHAGGVIAHPADCKILLDGCQPLLVKVNNESLDCFTGITANFTAMAGAESHPDNIYTADRLTKKVTKSDMNVTSSTITPPKQQTTMPVKDGVLAMSLIELMKNMIKTDQNVQTKGRDIPAEMNALPPNAASQHQRSVQELQPFDFGLFWPQDFFLSWYLL